MRKLFVSVLAAVLSFSAFAQPKLDTLYYEYGGRGVPYKEFADYYRIALYSDDPFMSNRYRDFHITGQVMSTGEFISLDKYDDKKSKFIGKVSVFDKNGDLLAVRNYKDGLLDGLCEEYLDDGTVIQEEFSAGKVVKDFYVKSDKEGNLVKVRYSNNSVIWESPDPSEMRTDYHEGEKWCYYSKNGVTLALNTGIVRDYGKYHSLNITIANNSLVPIEFEPSCNIVANSTNRKKGYAENLKVYSCEEYLRRYDNRTTWMALAYGISETSALIDGGRSETATVTVNDKGEKTVSYSQSYDALANYVSYSIARSESREFEERTVEGREARRVGYFKRSTIYPGDTVSGFVYVERIKADVATVVIDIAGASYTFTWQVQK